MKQVVLAPFALLFFSMTEAQVATADDSTGENCISAIQRFTGRNNTGEKRSVTSICVGDKVVIKPKDKNRLRLNGQISSLSNDVIIVDGQTIDFADVNWIKKRKLSVTQGIVGGILTIAGIGVIIHLSQGNVDLNEIAPRGLLGIGLVTAGVVAFTSRTKFGIASEIDRAESDRH